VIFLLKKCRFRNRKRKESALQPERARSCRADRASRVDPCIALSPRSPIAISPSISRDVGIATLQHFREREHAPTTKTCHGRSNYVCMDAQWHNLRCTARLGSITSIRQPILFNDRICDRSPCARDITSTTTINVTKFMPLSSLSRLLLKRQTRGRLRCWSDLVINR